MGQNGNQIDFKYITRGNSSPRNKDRVYFSCHPDDLKYLDHIAELLFRNHNCAIYYYDYNNGEPDPEEIKMKLAEMQLIVVPVTSNFLDGDNNAFDVEFHFAREKHIPILPLLQDHRLAREFNEKCDKLQYLDEYYHTADEIPFEEKLERFLSAVLLTDDVRKRVQEAFDARIFLSYRKKDRKEAQQLLNLIHSNKAFRNIAIWYDEFLTTGEPWDSGIEEALEKSDLFTLLVTPNLINEDNFVMRQEYPMANKSGKPILPAECVETDRKELEEKYESIPVCVNGHDEVQVSDALFNHLKKIAFQQNESPEHTYLLGLAYLSGIDVETNSEIAVEMITEAANENLLKAQEKLVEMYYDGIGVKRDIYTVIEWQEKVVEQKKGLTDKEGNNTEIESEIAFSLVQLGDYYEEASIIEKAEKVYLEACSIREKLAEENPKRYNWDLAGTWIDLGLFYNNQGKPDRAEEYYLKALPIIEKLAKGNPKRYNRDLATIFNCLGSLYYNQQNMDRAEEYYLKALSLREELAKENLEGDKKYLADTYGNLGVFYKDLEKPDRAEEYLFKAISLREELAKENPERYNEGLSGIYNNLGNYYSNQRKPDRAEEYFLKAISLREELAKENPDRYNGKLAAAYINMGRNYSDQMKPDRAEEYYLKALPIEEELAKENPERYNGDLATIYNDLGAFYNNQRKQDKAEEYYFKSLSLREELARENPERYNGVLSDIYGDLGIFYIKQGKVDRAEEYFLKSLSLREELAKENPEIYNGPLSDIYNNLGVLYKEQGKLDRVEEYLLKSLSLREELAKRNPEKYNKVLAEIYHNLGVLYSNQGKPDRAEKYLLKAISIREELVQENKRKYGSDLIDSYTVIRRMFLVQGNAEKATEYYFKERLMYTSEDESVRNNDVNYAQTLDKAAIDFEEQEEFEKAEKTYLQAVTMWEKLAEEYHGFYEPELATAYNNLGVLYKCTGEGQKAVEYIMKAIAIREKLTEKEPTLYGGNLAASFMSVGLCYRNMDDYSNAETYLIKAADLYEKLVKTKPRQFTNALIISYDNIIELYQKNGKKLKATVYNQKKKKITKE